MYYNNPHSGGRYNNYYQQPSHYSTSSYGYTSDTKEWYALAEIEHGSVPRAVLFDKNYELFWVGDEAGRLTSYSHPSYTKYSSVRVCDSDVKELDILSQHGLVLALYGNGIKSYTSGGVLHSNFSDTKLFDNKLLAFDILPSQKICLGGNTTKLFMLDFATQRVIQTVDNLTQGVCAMDSRPPNILCCGGTMGELSVRDIRTMKAEHSFEVHSGTISDIACKGDLLVTCGFAERYGELVVDTVIKTFDLRTFRLLAQVHFPAGPGFLNFHPMFSSMLCIASQSGYFQMRDIQAEKNSISEPLYQVDTQNELLQSVSMSSSGEMMLFGDSGGYVHIWTNSQKTSAAGAGGSHEKNQFYTSCQINKFSQSLESPSKEAEQIYLSFQEKMLLIDSEMPLSVIPTYESTSNQLLSDWPMNYSFLTGKEPPEIHPQIFSNLSLQTPTSTNQIIPVAATINPGLTRVQDGYTNAVYHKHQQHPEDEIDEDEGLLNVIAKPYRKLNQLKALSNKLDFAAKNYQEFDFSPFNHTRLIGLENFGMENTYLNSYIQVIYHLCPQVRTAFMNHLCNKPECLSCELGLLFCMMEQLERSSQYPESSSESYGKKKTCIASNLYRTFNRMRELFGHNLLDRESSSLAVGQRIVILNSMLLDLLYNETSTELYIVKHKKLKKKRQCMIDILFGSDLVQQKHCSHCNHIVHRKQLHLFSHNITISPVKHQNYEQALRNLFVRSEEFHEPATPCQVCQKSDFSQFTGFSYLPNILALDMHLQQEVKWVRTTPLPTRFVVSYDSDVNWNVTITDNLYETKGIAYELKAVVVQAKHPFSQDKGHLISFIRIPSTLTSSTSSSSSTVTFNWYMFNDYAVSLVSEEEVVNYSAIWKTPCILFYSRVGMDQAVPKPFFKNPINPLKVLASTQQLPEIKQLSAEDVPKKGDIVALDAEFVVLEGNNRHLDASNKLKPQITAFSLGRVSVIRPQDELPFIDDYISILDSAEQVTDYVTRYSGLKQGDLDISNTEHHVTHLKSAYVKLKALVDRGVIFVGHGLRNDFRIINILVPPEQIIDTSEIYQLPRQRKISLRFLAKHVLQKDIQSETHCSVEDAKSSLELYEVYKQLQAEGKFEDTLARIYNLGRSCNWQLSSVPTPTTSTSSSSTSSTTPSEDSASSKLKVDTSPKRQQAQQQQESSSASTPQTPWIEQR